MNGSADAPLRHYYAQMNAADRSVYGAVLAAMQACEASVSLPRLDQRTAMRITQAVVFDHPELATANLIGIGIGTSLFSGELRPSYLFARRNENRQAQSAFSRGVGAMAEEICRRTRDAWTRELLCYEAVQRRVRYAHEWVDTKRGATGYEALEGRAVCIGIALLFKALCDACAVPCLVLEGSMSDPGGRSGAHAWNMVRIGSAWYHADVTNDLPEPDFPAKKLYRRFNLSDDTALNFLSWDGRGVPCCTDEGGTWYRRTGHWADSRASFRRIVAEDVRNGEREICVQLSDGFSAEFTGSEAVADFAAASMECAGGTQFTYSWSPECCVLTLVLC